MTAAYRGRAAALRARAPAALEEIRSLESRIAPEAFEHLDPARLAALSAARAPVAPWAYADGDKLVAASDEEVEALALGIDLYVPLLRALAEDLPRLQTVANEASPEIPWLEAPSKSFVFQEHYGAGTPDEVKLAPARLAEAVGTYGAELLSGAWESERCPWVFRATFRLDGGTPFCAIFLIEAKNGFFLHKTKIGTTVPPARRPLLAMPRTSYVRRLFTDGFGPEIAVDGGSFDATFATRSSAGASLTDRARARLLSLSRYDVPTLTVARGVAEIVYVYDPERPVLRATIDALLAVREPGPPILLSR